MSVISEDFRRLDGVAPFPADLAFVYFTVPRRRENAAGTWVVVPVEVKCRLVAGKLTSPNLDPGEATVRIGPHGPTYKIIIPATDARLWDLIEMYETPDPPVVSLVKQYLEDTKEARDIAVAAAEGVAGIGEDLEQIAQDRAAAELARDKSIEAQGHSESSAGSAGDSATNAGNSARDAKDFRDGAEEFATAADGSATAAGQSEEAAAQHKVAAEAAAERSEQVAAGIQDVAADAAQVAEDRLAVESAAAAVATDRQTVTDARGVVVTAKGDVEQIQTDIHQTKVSIENTANLVDQTLEQYGAQFVADRELSQQAVTDATLQAQRAEDAAEGIIAGSVLDNAVTTPKLADEAVTKAKTSPAVQASLDKADGSVQGDDPRLTNPRTPTIHTHTEAQVTGLTAKLAGLQPVSEKGQANGYAPLDANGKLAAAYQPSYVDDVLEYANVAAFPTTGETGKIYTSLANNRIYRWSGSVYIEIAPSPGSTDVVAEGATNKYFTDARAQAALAAALALLAPKANPVFTGPVKGVPYPIGYVAALGTRAVGYLELPGGLTIPDACTITKIVYSFDIPDASGSTTAELRKNGATISGTSLAVTASNQAGGSATVAARTVSGLSVALAEGDVLNVYVSGIGTTPGRGLTANIKAVTS
ncbi:MULTISPECIES: hypothetical protein [unclassified Rhodococcus (in: high G+C Gram-positive bacteria)]|uniref:hypothetical protein n=1 Tax=unclassified Rhodococcus (in: high G+C Gram-positive bacteria) TaxID=192944 RepID=UPI00096A3FE7|nr:MULTISPECIES: hypothetical protein [unclassified Rhodococcus (in: high G+C Gram-positive bacteria)]